MEPTKDQFEQHVRGLYEGLEAPSPSTTKDAVFNALDQKSSTSYSGAALLVAASLIAVGVWFMSSEGQPEQPIHEQPIVVDDISEDIVVETAKETVTVILEDVPEDVATEIFEETTTEEPTFVDVSAEEVVEEVSEEEVADPIDNMEVADKLEEVVAEDLQVEEIKELVAPVEVKTTESAEKELEDKKEVEWVLPASIKVEK